MSEGTPTGKANAWTEEAKNEFLLRIIMQLKPEGKGINWSEVQMPGRTVKSLQNQWTAVNKRIDALKQQQQDGDTVPVPVKKATPRKRKVNKKVESEDDDDSIYVPKKSNSRKRSNTETPERAAKAIKAEAAELEDVPVKEETGFNVDSEHAQV